MAEPTTAEKSAQRSAVDRFLREIERQALRMAELAAGNLDDALELVQEAMLGFVRNYSNKPREQWPPLFFKVLDSRLQDFHRRQSVRRRWRVWLRGPELEDEHQSDPIEQAPESVNLAPVEHAQGQQCIGALDLALKQLPERQRQAFLLRVWEGFDGATTASIMGCTEGSVKTHLSRAMHVLRDRLEAYR